MKEHITKLRSAFIDIELTAVEANKIADALERLTAENEQLASEMADQGPCINGLRDKVVSLTAENAALKEGLDGWHARYLDMAAIAGEKHD